MEKKILEALRDIVKELNHINHNLEYIGKMLSKGEKDNGIYKR